MSDAAINMVQSGGLGQTSSIFIRGTNSEHALILRDGARLNTASTGAANLAFIDTTDIKQIEISKDQHQFFMVRMLLVVLYKLFQRLQKNLSICDR